MCSLYRWGSRNGRGRVDMTDIECVLCIGGAAGMVGDALNTKLSEHVRSTNNLFKDQVNSTRLEGR